MYNKELAKSIETKDIKYIGAGIQENVKLKSARTEVSPTGLTFLEITFEKDGATLKHTEWKPKKGQYVVTDEDLQQAENRQFKRMLQILWCFYKDEEINFTGSSFEEFAQFIVDMLNNANKDTLLRVKVVYNRSGYTTLPGYSAYTFIEPMELPEGQSSAIVALGIDQFNKPIEADAEKQVDPLQATMSSPAEVGDALNKQEDDLPF